VTSVIVKLFKDPSDVAEGTGNLRSILKMTDEFSVFLLIRKGDEAGDKNSEK
jgi:hypothetical protein